MTSAANASNLGALFSMCGDNRNAASSFRKAVQSDPSRASYWFNLASSLRAIGNIDGSEEACEKAIELNPQDAQAWYLLSDLKIQTPESNHINQIAQLLSKPRLDARRQTIYGFALAKELEDIGDYDRSFSVLARAADVYRQSINYQVSHDIEVIEAIIALHTCEALQALPQGCADTAPIFIVGLPRSGTTLLEQVIQSHSQIRSLGERNDFALQLSRLAREKCSSRSPARIELVERSLQIDMAQLGLKYLRDVGDDSACNHRLIDKMPINYLYCGLIKAALPNAKIIALRRSPMDSCYAAFKALLHGPYSFTYDLSELGRYFIAFRQLMNHWRDTLPKSTFVEVGYESLVTDFEAEARRILEFLELSWESSVLNYQSSAMSATASAAQIRRPLYATSIGKWKHYAKQLEPLRAILSAANLLELDAE